MENLETLEEKVSSAEKQVHEGKELTKEQLEELRNIALVLVNDNSDKAGGLKKRIIRVKNAHHDAHNVNQLRELEAEHDLLKKEYLDPATSEERKKQLAERSKEVSETLQILQR